MSTGQEQRAGKSTKPLTVKATPDSSSPLMSSTTHSSSSASSSPSSQHAPRVLLSHKVAEVRATLVEDGRAIQRIKGKLAELEHKKTPLILSLTQQLSRHQLTIDSLRAQLSAVHSTFNAEQVEAHAVYEAALTDMDAQFARSLQENEAAMSDVLTRLSSIHSFELIERQLTQKKAELTAANQRNELRHRTRMKDMEDKWQSSRRRVKESSEEVRRASERRYKKQVMSLLHISYSTIHEELQAMTDTGHKEEERRKELIEHIERARRGIEEEKEREAESQMKRRGKVEELMQCRLAIEATKREREEEEERLQRWKVDQEGESRREHDAVQHHWRMVDDEWTAWNRAVQVARREVERVQGGVRRVERWRSNNTFHHLTLECIRHVLTPSPRQQQRQHADEEDGESGGGDVDDVHHVSLSDVRGLSSTQRLAILQLLFARLHEAESRREQWNSQPPLQEESAAQREREEEEDGEGVFDAAEEVTDEAYTGGSFFVTQMSVDEVDTGP